jgi:hypothetical protein
VRGVANIAARRPPGSSPGPHHDKVGCFGYIEGGLSPGGPLPPCRSATFSLVEACSTGGPANRRDLRLTGAARDRVPGRRLGRRGDDEGLDAGQLGRRLEAKGAGTPVVIGGRHPGRLAIGGVVVSWRRVGGSVYVAEISLISLEVFFCRTYKHTYALYPAGPAASASQPPHRLRWTPS